MKIALAQLNYHIGNFDDNTEKIISTIEKARNSGADIVVFSELAVCGYPPLDFLEFEDFIERCEKELDDIAKASEGIGVIVGAPARNPVPEGKDLFNAAWFISDGKIISIHRKALLPNYDVFDEYRYFESGREFKVIEHNGVRIALTVCEDLWDVEENPMYVISPMDELKKGNPDIMINIAASPFSYNHYQKRIEVLRRNTTKYNCPLFYVNHVGAQTEIIFDGGSMVMTAKGEMAGQLKFFEEDFQVFDTNNLQPAMGKNSGEKYSRIYDALVLGIRDYFGKLGFKKAILGLSGGIDSAIVCVLAVEALGSENVLPVLMPGPFSSEHSVNDAIKLAENLGCNYKIIPIEGPYKGFLENLKPFFEDKPFDVTEENLQARVRGITLMAMSNKFGHILLNTSNKSELAVGYGTLYGDMAGGLSVIGDVYKTEIYALTSYINHEREIIPVNTIQKPPSAELRPDQKDSDSLPPYEILDEILLRYIEHREGPDQIKEAGFDPALTDRVLKLVNTNEYKRKQFAPILRVSDKAFGLGRRLPIVGKYLS